MANRQNVRAQSMLITLILLLGIRMVTPCKFVDLIEPDDEGRGWRVKVDPAAEFLDTYEFRWAMMHIKVMRVGSVTFCDPDIQKILQN